jgi:4-diphosphocytidyl-2-C-methyl-D-erythritol kinase
VTPPVLRALAPGKVNLALFLGQVRPDGRHDLVSLVQPVSLADELELSAAEEAEGDEVVCPGVDGPNLAASALSAYRAASGWRGPPVRVTIAKRIPVAAGMGGGSADAAATLRLVAHAAGRDGDPVAAQVAPALGSDVPALLEVGTTLVSGAGERVRAVAAREPFALVVVPLSERLATGDVFREADRLGLGRPAEELADLSRELASALQARDDLPDPALLVNDLEPAAVSLCPAIEGALAAVRACGAEHAMVSGSGPTVFGLFAGVEGAAVAAAAAGELAERFTGAVAAGPVGPDFAAIA